MDLNRETVVNQNSATIIDLLNFPLCNHIESGGIPDLQLITFLKFFVNFTLSWKNTLKSKLHKYTYT